MGNELKHTALPWTLEYGQVHSPDGEVVAKRGENPIIGERERDANMRYIIRACNAYPGLVEALLAIAMADEAVFGYEHPERKMIEIARAALAQAQGDE